MNQRDLNRRQFLRQVSLVLGAGAVAGSGIKLLRDGKVAALDVTLPAGSPILVMIELGGGNDILNTVIPYAHPTAAAHYVAARPQLGITSALTTRPYTAPAPGTYLPPGLDLDGRFALHGSLVWLANRWWTNGDVAVVHGTGENVRKDMSHFAAMSYRWAGAFTGPNMATGWLGRYNDLAHPGVTLGAISLSGLHQSLAGASSPAVAINSIPSFNWYVQNIPSATQWRADLRAMGDRTIPSSYNKVAVAGRALSDAHAAVDQVQGIPPPAQGGSGLAGQLATAAALIQAGVPCQTYVATLSGFDTHGGQPYYHFTQLAELDAALAQFFAVVDAGGRAADVFVMITSEFGRQISQNGSVGSDHGRGSATILVGGGVRGGAYGQFPDLAPAARDQDAMVPTVDFRSVWATVLNRLGGEPNLTEVALGKDESGNAFGDLGVFTTGPVTPTPSTSVDPGTSTTAATTTTTSMATTTSSTTTTSMPTTTRAGTTSSTSSTSSTTTSMPTTTKATTTTVKKTTTTTVKKTTTTVKRTTTTKPRRKR